MPVASFPTVDASFTAVSGSIVSMTVTPLVEASLATIATSGARAIASKGTSTCSGYGLRRLHSYKIASELGIE